MEVGIYRVPGAKNIIEKLTEELNNGKIIIIYYLYFYSHNINIDILFT